MLPQGNQTAKEEELTAREFVDPSHPEANRSLDMAGEGAQRPDPRVEREQQESLKFPGQGLKLGRKGFAEIETPKGTQESQRNKQSSAGAWIRGIDWHVGLSTHTGYGFHTAKPVQLRAGVKTTHREDHAADDTLGARVVKPDQGVALSNFLFWTPLASSSLPTSPRIMAC